VKENFYITKDGSLQREENTIYFENQLMKRALPINRINSIYCYGSNSMSSGAILYLSQEGIPVHFFDYYGWYKGSLYPRDTLVSGHMVVKQAEHYLDEGKRLTLAKNFVYGAIKNTLRNISNYLNRYPELIEFEDRISEYLENLENVPDIPTAMQLEGQSKRAYFQALDIVLSDDYKILRRTRRPPENRANTLISFGNSLLYTTCLTEIYNTQLDPTISFLHEPSDRRFSLSLDISEIFKPIIVDRIILKLVNKGMLDDDCFEGSIGEMMLSEKGKRLFIKEYDHRLNQTIKHRDLGRRVSYQRLIRLELYKLCKHCLGDSEYAPLIFWW
jgi:CRISPR-associated protein Cas1